MKKEKPYSVVSSTFLGSENGLYRYEITFNRSLVHTGRFTGIEDGLNRYEAKERATDFWEGLQGLWHTFFRLIRVR